MKLTVYSAWMLLLLAGCSQDAKLPPRKKMPEFNATETRPSANFPFATSDMDMLQQGNLKTFLRVALPFAGDDSVAMNLVNTYRPFALPLLTQWKSVGRDGVVIDLRSNTTLMEHRADYLLENIPVTFLWDRPSAARATAFINLMDDLPLNTQQLSTTHITQQNCFSSDKPLIGKK